jgi:hypothetical protein
VVDQFLDLGGEGPTPGDQIVFATTVSREGRPAAKPAAAARLPTSTRRVR